MRTVRGRAKQLEHAGQRFDEMVLIGAEVGTGQIATVLREERVPMVRVHHQTRTLVASEAIWTAGNGGKDVVRIHGAQNQRGTVPRSPAGSTSQRARPTFQTRHAHGAQMLLPPFHRHGNAGFGVLLGWEEESDIYERVAIVNDHGVLAHEAKGPWHSRCCQIGQDETANVVVAVAAFVLHFNVIRVQLVTRKSIEWAEIGAMSK